MSGYYESDSYDDDERQDNSGGGLRRQLEDTLKELRELRQQVTGSQREKTVTDLLADKNLDPGIAELIPADADPKAWIEQKGHLFVPAAGLTREEVAPETQVAPDDDPAVVAEREAREQMQTAQESGTPVVVTAEDIAAVEAMSVDDLLLKIKQDQAVNG